jgi:hypothetical protein
LLVEAVVDLQVMVKQLSGIMVIQYWVGVLLIALGE